MVEATNPNVNDLVWPQVDPSNPMCLQVIRYGNSADGMLLRIGMCQVFFAAFNPPLNIGISEGIHVPLAFTHSAI